MVRHDFLLLHAAVVLQGEDDRVIGSLTVKERKELTEGGVCRRTPWWTLPGRERHLEGVFLDGFDGVLEEDVRGEGVAVVDLRLVV